VFREVPEITKSLPTRTCSPLLGETIFNVSSLGGEDVGLVVAFCDRHQKKSNDWSNHK